MTLCLSIKYNKGINYINNEIELYIYINGWTRKTAYLGISKNLKTAFKSQVTIRRDGICSITS